MRPFGVITGGELSASLQVSDRDLAILIAAGQIPAPDAGACQAKNVSTWAWVFATASTAIAALTHASVQATLLHCLAPLPDGTPNVKPFIATVDSTWAL